MRKGAKKFNSNSAAARFFAAALALCVWQAGAMALGNDLLLVTPVAVARRLCELIVTADFWTTLGFTFSRISLGFLFALALAGILAAFSAAVASSICPASAIVTKTIEAATVAGAISSTSAASWGV